MCGVCFKPIFIYIHIIKGVGVTKYADCWSYDEKGTFYDSLIVEHVTLINDPSLIINSAEYENIKKCLKILSKLINHWIVSVNMMKGDRKFLSTHIREIAWNQWKLLFLSFFLVSIISILMLIPLFYFFCIASIHLAYKSTKRLRCLPLWLEMTRPSRKMIRRMLRKDNVCYLLQFSLDWVPVTVNIYYDIKSSNLQTACLGILDLCKTTHDPMTATCKWAFTNISEIFLPCLFMFCTRKIPVTSHVTNTGWPQGELSIVLSFQLLKQTLCRIIILGFMG